MWNGRYTFKMLKRQKDKKTTATTKKRSQQIHFYLAMLFHNLLRDLQFLQLTICNEWNQ